MQKITAFFVFVFAVAWASYADAALVFNADFGQDGTYDSSWPMRAGEVVAVDIYVSNVPTPGLFSMGFKLTYDPTRIQVLDAGTEVDSQNWPLGAYSIQPDDPPGQRSMGGFRGDIENCPAGDRIKLVTVRLECISQGESEVSLLDRGPAFDGFILADGLVKDEDLGAGVLLATIRPPILGDVNGDGLVNLADAIVVLKVMAQIGQGDVVHATGDVNGDGKIGLAEAAYAFQKAAGMR